MNLEWRQITLPEFEVPQDIPEIPKEVYEERCKKLYKEAESKWVIVYGDREHFANLHYLTAFDPRFEEAILVLGPNNKKHLIVGNEGLMYVSVAKPSLEVILYQSFSLMGQDRSEAPRLDAILRNIGISKGDDLGVCGWKYLEEEERSNYFGMYVPSVLVDVLSKVVGGREGLKDVTHILMDPVKGLRANNEVEQIAALEWGAARASAAIRNIVHGTKPGISELEAVSHMGYAGEPLSAHVMYASGNRDIVALRSPSGKTIQHGEGIFTAVGYWGGLCCRAGLVEEHNEEFIKKWAIPYYRGIAAWYEAVSAGSIGGEVYEKISNKLEIGGLRPLLNPGHLSSTDEWVHTMFQPNSKEKVASGMAIQCDIIPTPMDDGIVLNCEDTVVIADQDLRNQLAGKYPDLWKRIQNRRNFMREELGLTINEDLLPLSTIPGYYTPLFLSSDYALAVK
ncbi:M24 family metallopeptidase [Bacillus sp. FJAT-50079]|uniref:M24 family metallopeptidase n=1 Tax=Bacillus sp. FJAT-50079 TaxID=2833577 RepID=UPI001BCA4E61|nr:M24 family metallopeptidase [Bacillus sp. FJAT-50079]MBS4206650.1 M24 family metallopeptidase [Bacillus sp. FJAT-50079]